MNPKSLQSLRSCHQLSRRPSLGVADDLRPHVHRFTRAPRRRRSLSGGWMARILCDVPGLLDSRRQPSGSRRHGVSRRPRWRNDRWRIVADTHRVEGHHSRGQGGRMASLRRQQTRVRNTGKAIALPAEPQGVTTRPELQYRLTGADADPIIGQFIVVPRRI